MGLIKSYTLRESISSPEATGQYWRISYIKENRSFMNPSVEVFLQLFSNVNSRSNGDPALYETSIVFNDYLLPIDEINPLAQNHYVVIYNKIKNDIAFFSDAQNEV